MGILASKPEIRDDLRYIWRAFMDLSSSRPVGFDIGYVPLSELEVYCRLFEIKGSDRDFLIRCFRELDARFIELTRERNARKNKHG